ncbi:type IV pilus assembly protein FimV, partial [Giesbergeria giesbergeri]
MKLRPPLLALSAALFTSGAGALSLGGALGNVVLGRPLDIRFQIHADAAAAEGRLCLSAEVLQGEAGMGASLSTVTLQPAQRGKPLLARVQTNAPISEPVVTVQLSVGCTGVVRRSYTLLADLPESFAGVVRDASVGVQPLNVVAVSPEATRAPERARPDPQRRAKEIKQAASANAPEPVRPRSKVWVGQGAAPVVVPAAKAVSEQPAARLVLEPLGTLPNASNPPTAAPTPPTPQTGAP